MVGLLTLKAMYEAHYLTKYIEYKSPEIWFKFCNRNYLQRDFKYIFICDKHFEEKYIKQNKGQPRLKMALNPFPAFCPNI